MGWVRAEKELHEETLSMDTVITSIGLSVAVNGIILLAVKEWISVRIRSSIKHEYDLKLESHKAQLKSESATEIERLRADLRIAAESHNVRYTKVFDSMETTIAETYAALVHLAKAVNDHVRRWNPQPEMSEVLSSKVDECFAKLANAYELRRIYLPKEITSRVDELKMQFLEIRYGYEAELEYGAADASTRLESYRNWRKIYERLLTDIPDVMAQLEDEFRKTFGVAVNRDSEIKD